MTGESEMDTSTDGLKALFSCDTAELMQRCEIHVHGRIFHGQQGIAIANGRFGGPVWQDGESRLRMQLNHTDAFMYNDASAVSDAKGGALGWVCIDFGAPVFDDKTHQLLDLYRGRLTVRAGEITLMVYADMVLDRIVIEIDDKRKAPAPLSVELEMLRAPEVARGGHTARSALSAREGCGVLEQRFEEKCDTGLLENDFCCRTAVAIACEAGRETWQALGERRICLTLEARQGRRTVHIGGCADMSPCVDAGETAVRAALDPADPSERSLAWWHDFWESSWVYIPDLPEYELRRNYCLYLLAVSNRGRYPGKYNGGVWIGDGDRRDWGGWYWNWNQDSLYQPMLDANHAELLEPMFTMREACFDRYREAARQLWGAEGIFIGETVGVLGYERLPEDIAAGLRAYLTGDGPLDEAVRRMGERRNGFLTPWNWRLEGLRAGYVTHTLTATMETAEYYWMYWRYSGDMEFLRNRAWPFLKGAAELYRTYPGFVKEADGRYHFHRTNLHEHLWGARDVIDDHALARGVFAAAIRASELLDVDAGMRESWRECLDQLADYPKSTDEGALGYAAEHADGAVVFAQGRRPAISVRGLDGIESPQFKLLERFDVLNLETRDQGLDGGAWEIALNTYFNTPGYLRQYLRGEADENGSSRFLSDAARLGRAEELPAMLKTQASIFANTPNLLRDEGDYYSSEGYATWTAALQLALCQSPAPAPGGDAVIRVFPAWSGPDAKYRLAAKDGFLMSSSLVGGRVAYIAIEARRGGKCRVRSPWDGADLWLNDVRKTHLAVAGGDVIAFDTHPGDMLVLVRAGDEPSNYTHDQIAPAAPFVTDAPSEAIGGFWNDAPS